MKKLFFFAVIMFTVYLSQAQWQPDVKLTNSNAPSWTATNGNSKVIASKGDTLHVVWEDDRDGDGNGEVYYKRSTNCGVSWGPDTRLTNNDSIKYDPSIVVSGSVLRVVWSDERDDTTGNHNAEIYYKSSTDGGMSWGPDTRLTFADGGSESPSMAVEDSVIHIVWYDYRNDTTGNEYTDIYYKRSMDSGLTWGPDIRLTSDPHNYYSGYPGVAVSGSVVHVVWEDARNGGTGDVYYKRSTDGGSSWGPDTRLTEDTANSWDPCIALNNDTVRIVWEDDRDGNFEIYYKQSTDGGLTWGPDTRLTNNPADSYYPTIAVSGSKLHVVWQDDRYGDYEIFYKESLDGGVNWGADTRLTNDLNGSYLAFVAVTDSAVHVVWEDNRTGDMEIYYKRNPTGNMPVGIGNDQTNDAGNGISIYPNPASDLIHIALDNNLPGSETLSIRNILGEELLSRPVRNGETMIDVAGLQNGVYFIQVTADNKTGSSKKLIIAK